MADARYLAIVETLIRRLEEGGGSWTRESLGIFMGGEWPLRPSGEQFGRGECPSPVGCGRAGWVHPSDMAGGR